VGIAAGFTRPVLYVMALELSIQRIAKIVEVIGGMSMEESVACVTGERRARDAAVVAMVWLRCCVGNAFLVMNNA
jgi:hypothetical protein